MVVGRIERNEARLEDLVSASNANLQAIGVEIKRQRTMMGLTLKDFEKMIGVPEATLIKMERDSSKAQVRTVERACRALGMTVTIGATDQK